jgi:hypothetical protein
MMPARTLASKPSPEALKPNSVVTDGYRGAEPGATSTLPTAEAESAARG